MGGTWHIIALFCIVTYPVWAASHLVPVKKCFAGLPAGTGSLCCDVEGFGPQGLTDCWDSTYTFESCCLQPPQLGTVLEDHEVNTGWSIVKLVPVEKCFIGLPAETGPMCCDIERFGPRGLTRCWDSTYTFESCCLQPPEHSTEVQEDNKALKQAEEKTDTTAEAQPGNQVEQADSVIDVRSTSMPMATVDFSLQYCCGLTQNCATFWFHCRPGQGCEIETATAMLCDSHPLSPPFTVIQNAVGAFTEGNELELEGTLYFTSAAIGLLKEDLRGAGRNGDSLVHKSVNTCVGIFDLDETFGTCQQAQDPHMYQKVGEYPLQDTLLRTLQDIDCSLCRPPRCKIYAVAMILASNTRVMSEHRLVLAVPSNCSHGDVALQIVPHIMDQRLGDSPFMLHKVKVHRFHHGDSCQHRGRPSIWPAAIVSLSLMILPRLLNLFHSSAPRVTSQNYNDRQDPHSSYSSKPLNAIDFIRMMALWNTLCIHMTSDFPFFIIADAMNQLLWPADPFLCKLLRERGLAEVLKQPKQLVYLKLEQHRFR